MSKNPANDFKRLTADQFRPGLAAVSNVVAEECAKLINSGHGDQVAEFMCGVMSSVGATAGNSAKLSRFDARTARVIRDAMVNSFRAGYRAGMADDPGIIRTDSKGES